LYRNKFYVPNSQELRILVKNKMHNVPYVGHLGHQKTIVVVRGQYFWLGMKKHVVGYIVICLECQKVKFKHRHHVGLIQPFPIPKWKWEVVTINSITKLHRTIRQHGSIVVVVNKLIKFAYFIPVKINHRATKIVEIA